MDSQNIRIRLGADNKLWITTREKLLIQQKELEQKLVQFHYQQVRKIYCQ